MPDDKVRFTREQLHDLVWSRPITAIAAEFGMSSVAFARHVGRLGIPRPGRGYWQQIAAGQRPQRNKLPRPTPGTPTEVTIRRRETRPAPRGELGSPPVVAVSATPAGADPVVEHLRGLLTQPNPRSHGMRDIRGDGHAVIKFAQETEERAFLILSALIRSLRARGHDVRIRVTSDRGPKRHVLEAVMHGAAVEFWLTEHVHRSEHVPSEKEKRSAARTGHSWAPRHDFKASGRLALETSAPWGSNLRKRWADGKAQRLDDMLGDVVVGLEAAAGACRAADEAREQERLHQETRRLTSEEEQRRSAHLQTLGEDLEKMAARWRNSETVTAFLDAFEQRRPVGTQPVEVAAWLGWARAYANAIDPLSNLRGIPQKVP